MSDGTRTKWFGLRFVNPLVEREFEAQYSKSIRRRVRGTLILFMIIYVSGILYYSVVIGLTPRGQTYFAGIVFGRCLLCAIGFVLLSERFTTRFDQAVLCVFFLSLSTLGPVWIGPEPGTLFLSDAIIDGHRGAAIVLMIIHAASGLRFAYSTGAAVTFLSTLFYFLSRCGHCVDLLTNVVFLFVVNVIGMFASYQLETKTRRDFSQSKMIEAEKQKSEDLLLNVLPEAIATRLRANERSIADDFADVTILFADIVSFTPLAEQLGPKRLVKLLDELFLKFDTIAESLGVEKIETIGDGYLAAGGAPTALDDHPQAVAKMAIAMVAAAGETLLPGGESVRIRIGIHTGPIIGGVIGKKRLHYDIFGETVNVASRIEGQAEPGRILVSEVAHKRIQKHFSMKERGEVELKGHGLMRTWWLEGT